MSITIQLAKRIRQLRRAQGLSIDALAERSGVSKSNISLIERGESNPTATVLDKLATGLGVVLASLFDGAPFTQPRQIVRADEQPVWMDPASGYTRRHLSPPGAAALQLVEIHFPVGQKVTYETAERDADVLQQVWVMEGEMNITVGNERWTLSVGDCLSMRLNQPITYDNPSTQTAKYIVAIMTLTPIEKR